jgi:hypothetical protein
MNLCEDRLFSAPAADLEVGKSTVGNLSSTARTTASFTQEFLVIIIVFNPVNTATGTTQGSLSTRSAIKASTESNGGSASRMSWKHGGGETEEGECPSNDTDDCRHGLYQLLIKLEQLGWM